MVFRPGLCFAAFWKKFDCERGAAPVQAEFRYGRIQIDYFKYDFRREAFVTDRDKVFGWFNGIFRLMPIPLSRMLGLLLYRHLS